MKWRCLYWHREQLHGIQSQTNVLLWGVCFFNARSTEMHYVRLIYGVRCV